MLRAPKRWGILAVVVASVLPSVLFAATPSAEAFVIPDGHGAVIAIVIDDVLDNRKLDAFLELDAPLTYAVFLFSRGGAHASERIRDAGGEVIVHLPVTSRRSRPKGRKLGPNWPAQAVDAFVERALASVPGVHPTPQGQGVRHPSAVAGDEHAESLDKERPANAPEVMRAATC